MEGSVTVPELLVIPDKLYPIITKFNSYRYALIDGGRGGGKSQAVARFILFLAEKKPLRIVCGRETQNSINESVYSLMTDLIKEYNLYFDIGAQSITHKETKSQINFRGFREQGRFNIQGLEGVSLLWIDEAQAITKQTLDVLIPTIRKDQAKLFFTMNRHVVDDPVYDTFCSRSDCLSIHLDYHDNPFCTDALKREALECQARSIDDYNHIWLGQPLMKGEDRLLAYDMVVHLPKIEFIGMGTQKTILACDVARFGDDETVFTVLRSHTISQWEQVHQQSWSKKATTETAGKLIDLARQFAADLTVVDEGGVGGGVVDMLNEQNNPPIAFNGAEKSTSPLFYNMRSQSYFALKDVVERGQLKIMNDPILIDQLLSIKYKYKSDGSKIIWSKDDMKKEGIKSPDRADALMMAVSAISRVLDVTTNAKYKEPRTYEDVNEYAEPRYA